MTVRPHRCPFCRSGDHMIAFRRSPRILLLSFLVPRLRRLYCRACARHFPALVPERVAQRTG